MNRFKQLLRFSEELQGAKESSSLSILLIK